MGREDSPLVTVCTVSQIEKEEVLEFAKNAYSFKEDPAHVNMWNDNWETDSATLPYLIYNSPRFANNNGEFFVCKVNGVIQAISGVHKSSFDSNVALAGVRSWVDPDFRGHFLIGQYIMPLQRRWAKDSQCKMLFLTFNDYNKNLIKVLKRSGAGRKRIGTYSGLFENGMHEAPYPCNIQSTKQWVVYDLLDINYVFDWEKIKW